MRPELIIFQMTKHKKVSSKEVERIAALAKINLTEQEKEKFSKELSDILGYIEQLQEVDTENVKPVAQISSMVNVFRKDAARNCDEEGIRTMIKNFPDRESRFVKVKKIL